MESDKSTPPDKEKVRQQILEWCDEDGGIRQSAHLKREALREILWVQIKLSQMEKNCTAETKTAFEAARFGFQLLNAPVDAFG